MKTYLAAVIAVAIGLAPSAGSAQTLSFQRCWHAGGGETTDGRFETNAPFFIHISSRADSYIAAHAGIVEGRPRFSNPRQVPCEVAFSVATKAMVAWEYWPRDTGSVGVAVSGITARPYLGRFYCTGLSYESSGRTYETCAHTGTRVGTIAVQFVIKPTS